MPGDFTWTAECAPVCELGLSDVREPEPDSWMDVSCFVHECEIATGRERFSDRFEPGTASITFDNRTGWGDLVGSPAVVATQTLRPGRPMRVGIDGPWGRRWLFRGWIDRCVPTYDPVLHDIVTVECIDALGEAGTAVAPTGPLVGANETVDVRLNRVLDAVGWFPTKRTIGASTTTVTATTLGSRAIDHMSQAADSAGGVVYGDLAGNVVYRDIGWELFDPDDPPDGTIGNVDPGTPSEPFIPGYIDPVPGYVYDPDPPPITSRTVVKVCSDGTEGVLVEQGDGFRIEAQDGRLLFESSGHFWDLGPFEGGCVAVAFDPETGGPPVRWDGGDGPDEDEVWEIAPFPVIELPPAPPMVELLAYAQGGIADGPQSTVTVGPITPGPDCMLFLLVAAGNATVGSNGLGALTATGGGFDWTPTLIADSQVRSSQASYPGMSAFLTYVEVGRDDPGTFSVTVDWSGADQSSCHAVTLYRARGAASDLYDRLKNRYRAYAEVSHTGPGNGPADYTVFDDYSPVPIQFRPIDVTIAMSLAESTTPPYGATFGGAGDWTIPPLASDITREISWNTGTRTNTLSSTIEWADVNIGAENIRSSQVMVNVEPSYARLFSWKVIGYGVDAPASGTIASGSTGLFGTVADEGSMIVVFVSVTADHDMADAITVTKPGMTFTAAHRQHKTGSSWGQGAIFTATVPAELAGETFADDPITVGWVGHTINTRSTIVYEVTNPGAAAAVGGGVLGTHTANSVDGASSITLGAAPGATSVVLASLHVSTIAVTAGDGAQTGGDDYVEEYELDSPTRAYFHTQSRGPDTATSTDPVVDWNDVHTGPTATYSGVQLAVEITPGPDFVMFSEPDAQLVIGGEFDAFNGPIFNAERRDGLDPNEGDIIWQLAPLDVVPP